MSASILVYLRRISLWSADAYSLGPGFRVLFTLVFPVGKTSS